MQYNQPSGYDRFEVYNGIFPGNMMKQTPIFLTKIILFFGLVSLFLPAQGTAAQENQPIQEVNGGIEPGAVIVYRVSNLVKGQTVYAYAAGTSGNLDPLIALVEGDVDPVAARQAANDAFNQAISAGEEPVTAYDAVADAHFLAWDDDSGQGYDAALAFSVPADGSYLVAIASSRFQQSAGDYRLLIGVDSPEVLTGEAESTTENLVVLQEDLSRLGVVVQQIFGTLTEENSSTFYDLYDLKPGETLYATIEATAGDLAPILILEDFGEKVIQTGNYLGKESGGSLQYTFRDEAQNYRLSVSACCENGQLTSGDYRLVVGVNAPDIMTGSVVSEGNPIVKGPVDVQIGVKMQQISNVDQKAENFGIVATMMMEWNDPNLAYSPDTCNCNFKLFRGTDFVNFVNSREIPWPEFTLFNQQGRRDTQNQLVVVFPDGRARYIERFSVTLQAPDFDFRRFPFDSQQFFIRFDSLFPAEYFTFSDLPDYSGLGQQLGEEEWIITRFGTEITTETASTQQPTSRFSFGFEAKRHLSFYIIRVFIPLLVIIAVSWITFFLQDYGKRIDVSAGNLLLFIAFNFTISGDLPRLGYLTLLDTVLIVTFVVTALVVTLNVALKRLELTGREELAKRIDRFTIWVYPLAYIVGLVVVNAFFT